MPSGFYWPGLADWSSFLALDEAMAFWDLVWKPQKLLVRVGENLGQHSFKWKEVDGGKNFEVLFYSRMYKSMHPFVVR